MKEKGSPMSRPGGIDVLHCILATLVRQHGSRSVFDLLEVTYEVTVPPDTEFPKLIAKFDVFLRLVGRSAGPTRFRIRVHRRVSRGVWELVNDFRPHRRLPFPSGRTAVLSQPVRLQNVKLTGTGLYAIRVFFRPAKWKWELGAVEYFRVVR
jgi:hypothetical protein